MNLIIFSMECTCELIFYFYFWKIVFTYTYIHIETNDVYDYKLLPKIFKKIIAFTSLNTYYQDRFHILSGWGPVVYTLLS